MLSPKGKRRKHSSNYNNSPTKRDHKQECISGYIVAVGEVQVANQTENKYFDIKVKTGGSAYEYVSVMEAGVSRDDFIKHQKENKKSIFKNVSKSENMIFFNTSRNSTMEEFPYNLPFENEHKLSTVSEIDQGSLGQVVDIVGNIMWSGDMKFISDTSNQYYRYEHGNYNV